MTSNLTSKLWSVGLPNDAERLTTFVAFKQLPYIVLYLLHSADSCVPCAEFKQWITPIGSAAERPVSEEPIHT